MTDDYDESGWRKPNADAIDRLTRERDEWREQNARNLRAAANAAIEARLDAEQRAAAMREAAARIADKIAESFRFDPEDCWRHYGKAAENIAAAIRALPIAAAKPQGNLDAPWKCPINHKGCTKNCGSYGCGN